MELQFSIIIPVYNRPQEIEELLKSCTLQTYKDNFEIIIIEDGSEDKCVNVVKKFETQLNLKYFYKKNSGAGASRNYGMEHASGNYFIILDSDVLLPIHYLDEVHKTLTHHFTDAFGGPDAAHESFTTIQKAINYSMTSLLTTGGIRGKKIAVDKFQPRSFNMGISKIAFEKTKGFSKMKYGEDIDLSLKLLSFGYKSQLIDKAFVYHKRRSNFNQFLKQTYNFGTARPILNKKYPLTAKITFWFPALFIFGLIIAVFSLFLGYWQLCFLYKLYFIILFIDASIQNRSVKVGFMSIFSTLTQFAGYGFGFFKSYANVHFKDTNRL